MPIELGQALRNLVATLKAAGLTLLFLAGAACEGSPAPALPDGFGLGSRDANLLQRPRPGLSPEQRLEWSVGKSFATLPWVSAPSTTTARDGLGPLFNANSCSACHQRNGHGRLPGAGPGLMLKLRASKGPDTNASDGEQLQDRALPGLLPEGKIAWHSRTARRHGELLSYRHYYIDRGVGGTETVAVSARLAPALIGQGLIDAVDEAQLIALADPEDANGDGISGRVNRVWDRETDQLAVGRFGWKAGQASLRNQIARALSQDLGVRSSLLPEALCSTEETCDGSTEPEITDRLLDAMHYYIANLAVPAPPKHNSNSTGAALFRSLGCDGCHRPTLEANLANGQRAPFQLFSDLLLHDMGPELADSVAEFNASGREWRTAPLWGLGLRAPNDDNSRLLHDGRAASVHEAILWHGGEAQAVRRAYAQLPAHQQQQLTQFLKAL